MQSLDLDSAFQAYVDAKNVGVKPDHVVFTNLLCLTAGLGEQGCGSAVQRPKQPPQDIDKAFVIFEDMKAQEIPLSEAAFTAMIRCCSLNDRPQEALSLYNDMVGHGITPRIRTMSAMLALLSKHGDVQHCEEIFGHIAKYDLLPTEKEFASMLHLYTVSLQPDRFQHYLSSMMEELLVLSHEETMLLIEEAMPMLGYTSCRSSVSPQGVIACNNEQLQSIELSDDIREKLLAQLESFAVNRDPNHKFKPNNKLRDTSNNGKASQNAPSSSNALASKVAGAEEEGEAQAAPSRPIAAPREDGNDDRQRAQIWQAYKHWLQERYSRQPFDLIVDGANVGYYKQNYLGAPKHVAYEQINHMLELLLEQGRCPLLILHSRHLSSEMIPSPVEQALIDSWLARGLLYATPKKFNDDWFWMYAAIQYRCRVVSNDDLRDHHFQLFSPRYFMQWRERSRVMYEMFSHFHDEQSVNGSDEERESAEEAENVARERHEADRSTKLVASGAKGKDAFASRTIKMFLRWPRPFSHRIQHVTSSQVEGWYFPPLIAHHPAPVIAPPAAYGEKRIKMGTGKTASKKCDAEDESDVETLEGQVEEEAVQEEEEESAQARERNSSSTGTDSNRQWWCFYRSTADVERERNTKRKRSAEE